ncbi:MAG: helix-hairpin-helix domain-containing protein [Nitrospinota bacterium]|nr:helix-hairpin-helix domain-containing protein [Nitrospinota bacterium]
MVLSKGVEGFKKLPGIGPKKAANIFNLVQTHASAGPASESDIEEDQALVSESEDEVVEPISGETDEEEEELDIPVEQLQNIEPRFIEMLKKNGFQTLAELSITSLEELLDIEGMDEETARITIEQAKQHMGNFENA